MKKLVMLASITLVLLPFLAVADNDATENKRKISPQLKTTTTKAGRNKQTNAGLRSDGELVQAKKGLNLIGQELSHTQQQQGRMSTSSDLNAASNSTKDKKPLPRETTTLSYEEVSFPKNKKQKDNNNISDSRDRFANQEIGVIKNTIPKKKAAISSLKKQRSLKPVQIRQPLGTKCNPQKFPKYAIVKQMGKPKVVKCFNGKIRISDTPQTGVRPFDRKKLPKKKIKSGTLTDEMPEDLPAG